MEREGSISSMCSAFSGETMMNSTVTRGWFRQCIQESYYYCISGGIVVYEPRLTLVATIQPEPFGEVVNKPDPQGYFDRFSIHIYYV